MLSAGRKPFGYCDYELAVIEQLFIKANRRPHGRKPTLRKITDSLNKDGHKTQTGKPWYPIAVGRIIRNGLEYYKKLHDKPKLVPEPEPEKEKKQPKEYLNADDYLTDEQVRACRAVLKDGHSVLFELLLGSGLRASECCELEIRDIGIYDGKSQIDVRTGKGAKRRSVIIGLRLKEILKDYLKFTVIELNTGEIKKDEPLFLNRRGKKLTYQNLYDRILIIRARSGVKCLHTHALRHTFGTYLYNCKKDLEYVRQQLGHSNINTTRIYAKTLSKSKLEQMEEYEKSFDP